MSTRRKADQKALDELLERGDIPGHIAVIMDGNGRWAKERGLLRIHGHKEGVESVREIVEGSARLGVKFLTLYTFSTENWQRPAAEVNALMQILIRTLRKETESFARNGIRLRAIGDRSQLPEEARRELEEAIQSSTERDRLTLILALSYSGRWDITQAAKKIAGKIASGTLKENEIDESSVEAELGTAGIPDPDLLIRTGGEIRVSNFLLWQIAYSELFFTETYWPSFRREHLFEAIRSYQDRERRFGRVLERI